MALEAVLLFALAVLGAMAVYEAMTPGSPQDTLELARALDEWNRSLCYEQERWLEQFIPQSSPDRLPGFADNSDLREFILGNPFPYTQPGWWFEGYPADQTQAPNWMDSDSDLSENDRRVIAGLERQIRLHEQKLADYIADPYVHDNLGLLENAPNDAVRERIISGRIKSLQHEIQNWKNQIDAIRKRGK